MRMLAVMTANRQTMLMARMPLRMTYPGPASFLLDIAMPLPGLVERNLTILCWFGSLESYEGEESSHMKEYLRDRRFCNNGVCSE